MKNKLNFKGIIDTTLRDGQQSPLMFDSGKYRFNLEEKMALINGLVNLGITHIEFFAPVVSREEKENFLALKKYIPTITNRKIMLLAHVRSHEDDIAAAIEAGFDGLNLYLGVAKHSREFNHGMSYEKIVSRIPALLKTIREKYPNLYLRFSAEDSFRTPLSQVFYIYDRIHPFVNTLGMPDTVGFATPELVRKRIRATKKRYPDNDIECHFHNDRGYSIANAITAIEEGANYIDCSIWGLAERSGITSATGLLLNLKYLDKDISKKYNLNLCYPLNVLMGSILKLQVPYTEPVSLTNRTHTAGVHQKAVLNNASVYEAHNLADFGVSKSQVLLGPLSGWNLIYYYLKEVENYIITPEAAKEITKEFKIRTGRINKNYSPVETLLEITSKYSLTKVTVPEKYNSLRLENLT
jgi:homocitrate synthase